MTYAIETAIRATVTTILATCFLTVSNSGAGSNERWS
jgi:hypothetical protein